MGVVFVDLTTGNQPNEFLRLQEAKAASLNCQTYITQSLVRKRMRNAKLRDRHPAQKTTYINPSMQTGKMANRQKPLNKVLIDVKYFMIFQLKRNVLCVLRIVTLTLREEGRLLGLMQQNQQNCKSNKKKGQSIQCLKAEPYSKYSEQQAPTIGGVGSPVNLDYRQRPLT
jgi:hypothetical protein